MKKKILVLSIMLTVGACCWAQSIQLKLNNVTVKKAMTELKQKSGYSFVYETSDLDTNKKVNVDAENAKDAIAQILQGQNVTYEIQGKNVVVQRKNANNTKANQGKKRTVKGTVKDNNGEPVIGATIMESGTKNGTVTDADGNFVIEIASDSKLDITSIGYKSQTVKPSATGTTSVSLSEDSNLLDDVVVVGYGTQRKKLITGSTVHVTADDIAAVNAVDAFGALQSQASGMNIVMNSGQPGEGYKVTIRGMGTAGSNTPLYVVDGVPGANIDDLSPNDIESIDVLKDAASSAIYGARASNGVILVTTKKGKAGGHVQVSFDGYMGWQNPNTNDVTPLNAKQYMEINDKAYQIQGVATYDWQKLIPKQYAQIMSGTWNGTNWLEETTIHNAPIHNASLSISGGSEISRFALGFTKFHQTGTIGAPADSKYDRYTVRLNSDYSLIKKKGRDILKIGENATFSATDKRGVSVGGIYGNSIRNLLAMSPLLPAYNDEGGYYEYKDIQADAWDFSAEMANPLAQMKYDNGFGYTKVYRLQTNFFLEFSPIKDLTYRASAGWLYRHREGRSYVPVYELSSKKSNPNDDVSQNQSYSVRWSLENTLNWVKSFDKHNIDVLLGQSVEKWGYGNGVNVTNSNSLFPGSFDHAYIANANVVDPSLTSIGGSPEAQGALSSFFGRVNYNYDETYLLSLVLRADGSSNFARGHRWGYFPSVSAGWVISNEKFMESTKAWMDFLKIRASWGQNGNCNISNFQYLATIALDDPYYFNNKDNPALGAYPNILPNEDVKWETSEQLDFGFDARFLNNRLGVAFDWYKKTTKDWLVRAPMLLSYGTNAPYVNGGDIENKGYEIQLNWNDKIGKDFRYSVSANFSHNKNEVTRLANSEGIIHGGSNAIAQNTAELYRIQVGYPIGYFWGYEMEGIIQNEKQLQEYLDRNCSGDKANSLQGESLQPGDVMFKDVNGNGKIDKGDDDKTMIGDPNPDFTLGLNINISYKGFDFALNGYGSFGQQVAKSYRQFSDHPDDNYCTDVYTKYWTGEGSTNRYPRFSDGKTANMSEISRVWIEDADFFKISRISLGYDFKRLYSKLPVQKCRLYVALSNFFTFTGYSGMDPEVGFGNGASWASGIDCGYYPSARSWQVGLNINF
ncbi:MAG: TonB-dependent receptor [Prevotella sp.]|nr:TonB-dependent receptor [Prevotella sp.]